MISRLFAKGIFVLPVLLSQPVLAQLDPAPTSIQDAVEIRAWPDRSQHPGAFRGMARAHLTGIGYPDLVFMCGNDPMLMVAPAVVNQVIDLPDGHLFSVEELCAISRTGHPDSLALRCTDGLHHWSYDHTNGTVSSSQITSTTWVGASDVCHLRGTDLIATIDSTTQQVLLANIASSIESQIAVGLGILDIEAADWDDDGIDELAVLHRLGMLVYEADGTLLTSKPLDIDTGVATRVGTPGADVVAILATSYGWQWLVTYGANVADATLLPGDVVSLAAGDGGLDGWDELALAYDTRSDLGILANSGAAPPTFFTYVAGAGLDIAMPGVPNAPGNIATANGADLDGDGYGDMVYPLEATGDFAFARSPFSTTEPPRPVYVGVYSHGYSLSVDLDPDRFGPVPNDATHVQIITWKGVVEGSEVRTESGRVDTNYAALDPGPEDMEIYTSVPDGMSNIDGLVMMLRFVKLDASGEVMHVWPPTHAFVTVKDPVFDIASQQPGFNVIPGGIGGSATGGSCGTESLPPPTEAEEDPVTCG